MKKILVSIFASISFAAGAADAPVGAPPPAADVPVLEFAFEERVTVAPPVVLGNTALGYRQYIPITGGTVSGPRLKGQVLPGGHDFQLTYSASDCTELTADYFLKAEDGTVIHVFNQGMFCPTGGRGLFRPKLEAPKGPHGWMTQAMFVATLEIEPPPPAAAGAPPPAVEAVRIRFYQLK